MGQACSTASGGGMEFVVGGEGCHPPRTHASRYSRGALPLKLPCPWQELVLQLVTGGGKKFGMQSNLETVVNALLMHL